MWHRISKIFIPQSNLYVGLMTFIIILLLRAVNTRGGILDMAKNRPRNNIATVHSMRCLEHDRKYVRFTECGLKAINRTLKLASVRIKLLQPPLTNASMTFVLFKRTNGYRPFFINFTIDVCKYLDGGNSRFIDWIYDVVKPYSNINHTCPFESEIVVQNLPVTAVKFPPMLLEGDYRFDYHFLAFNVKRASTQIFVSLKEE